MADLADQEYIRQRIAPRPGDPDYLVLSDLLLAIKDLVPGKATRVLDYGCGGSPYRPLFNSTVYHRADLAGGADLDMQYGADALLPTTSSYYECILSSQVLEHVESPQAYLAECHRVLHSGGNLLLSTHGIFQDHDCPADYWRWTASGLRKLVESAGFRVRRVKKVTTGPRAAIYLLEREQWRLKFSGAGPYGQVLSQVARLIWRTNSARRHQVCDASFPSHRVADSNEAGHDTYICLALEAER